MLKNKKRKIETFSVKEVVALLVITCVINIIVMLLVSGNLYKEKKDSNNNIYNDDVKEIIDTYQYIKDNYYETYSKEELVNGAIKGMMASLGDKNTTFIEEEDTDTYEIILNGEYKGLGFELTLNQDNKIQVYSIFPDSPVSKSGIKVGDIILSVNGKSTEGMTTKDLGDIVKKGSVDTFKMQILRAGKTLEFTATRTTITLTSVSSEIMKKNNSKIGYIYVNIFAANTDKQFKEQLDNLEKQGINSLIIDLRGNSGGHLLAAHNMISQFLDSSNIIYKTDKKGVIEDFYSNGSVTKKYPIVILADEDSASASEIMIGALTEKYHAILVGKKTFGKGTAQELINIPSTGEYYKITTKKWLTPNGNLIDKVGFTPKYDVTLSETYLKNPIKENDNQLQKAIEVLTQSNINE